MKIGFFDSGKGGTSILDVVKKLLPNEEYMYIGDSENCPYGEKSDEELIKIVQANVDRLKDWGATIIVIACNTATTRCIDKLRKIYPDLKFVGTEPAVKLAIMSGVKKVLVMATPGTIKSERLLALVRDNEKQDQEVDLMACPGLADAIEKDEDIDGVLDELLKDVKEYDAVVLGCTHYSLIKNKIQRYFPNAKLIDGNEGVAKRVKIIINEK
ncbi:glutamate racemase [Candidatus Saccharibacteria bacterium]|nr:glutamate racemase [Candidatus Saccharibacteria bacterium]